MISLNGLIDLVIDGSTWSLKTQPPLNCQILPVKDHFLVIPSDASGGLRGGDSQTIKIHLKNGAKAIWQASSASIIYPPASGLRGVERSRITCDIIVEDSSSLQFRNRTNILCKDSELDNASCLHVSSDSQLLYQEFFHAGRLGLDEGFEFKRLGSQTSLFCDKVLLYKENWQHHNNADLQHSPAGFNGARAWGTGLWFGNIDQQSLQRELDRARSMSWQINAGDITSNLAIMRYMGEFPSDQNNWNPHFEGYQVR